MRPVQIKWSSEIAPGPRAMIRVSSESHRICSGQPPGTTKSWITIVMPNSPSAEFVLLAEQIERLLADREAVHLGLPRAPEHVGDRNAGRERNEAVGNTLGQAAALFEIVAHEHRSLLSVDCHCRS